MRNIEPDHGKNAIEGLNVTDKSYLMRKMKLIGKLGSNDTTNIEIIPRASKDVSIKCSDQCLHILNNKEGLNGLKGITKMQKR